LQASRRNLNLRREYNGRFMDDPMAIAQTALLFVLTAVA
jgi:hypothetical protein